MIPLHFCIKTILTLLLTLLLNSCAGTLTSSLIRPALDNMQRQTDIELVCEGTPSYLLLIDSIVASDPQEEDMLILGAKSYSSYIGAMKECGLDKTRIGAMADKAHLYGTTLLGLKLPVAPTNTLQELDEKLQRHAKSDVAALFWGSFAWIAWIEQQAGAPAAMADLGKIEKILLRTIELNENFQAGAAHFLLGAYYGSRPRMYGGKPEASRFHFDKALQLSERKMLIVQTTYAQTLARTTMDRKLHDLLLHEVTDFAMESSPENMLANRIAFKRAQRLLQEKFFADE